MKGNLVIIIGVSGAGKTELVKALLKRIPDSTRLITTTTRPPRPGEKHGKDFYFISKEDFKKKIEAGDFIEYAKTHEDLYGSSKESIDTALATSRFVFAIIDVKGAQALKAQYPEALAVFLYSGDMEEVKQRLLVTRKNSTSEDIAKRLKTAEYELGFKDRFDAVVHNKNGHFDEAIEDMTKLLI